MNNSIQGIWHSRYEYDQGPDNKPQSSEHKVEFVQEDNLWIGTSVPNEEGSELTITVHQNGNEFKGEWRERTSPAGSYDGREFDGIILLILQPDGNELAGMWLGVSGSTSQVKSGVWTLRRA